MPCHLKSVVYNLPDSQTPVSSVGYDYKVSTGLSCFDLTQPRLLNANSRITARGRPKTTQEVEDLRTEALETWACIVVDCPANVEPQVSLMSAVAFVNAGSSTKANENCVPCAVNVSSMALVIVCV